MKLWVNQDSICCWLSQKTEQLRRNRLIWVLLMCYSAQKPYGSITHKLYRCHNRSLFVYSVRGNFLKKIWIAMHSYEESENVSWQCGNIYTSFDDRSPNTWKKAPLYKCEAPLLESVLKPKTYITTLRIKAYSLKKCNRDEMNQMKHKNQRT